MTLMAEVRLALAYVTKPRARVLAERISSENRDSKSAWQLLGVLLRSVVLISELNFWVQAILLQLPG
jgi:hypothetical protein